MWVIKPNLIGWDERAKDHDNYNMKFVKSDLKNIYVYE